jgi:hypothetical protein
MDRMMAAHPVLMLPGLIRLKTKPGVDLALIAESTPGLSVSLTG